VLVPITSDSDRTFAPEEAGRCTSSYVEREPLPVSRCLLPVTRYPIVRFGQRARATGNGSRITGNGVVLSYCARVPVVLRTITESGVFTLKCAVVFPMRLPPWSRITELVVT